MIQPTPERLVALNTAAAAWFTAAGSRSPEYAQAVTARGHRPALLTRLGVGYAPTEPWTGLTDELRNLGYRPDELLASGLVRQGKNGRLYDAYRGRVVFPIRDDHQQVAGFTARDITGRTDFPKYLNTPATAVFDKRRLLYGLGHITDTTAALVLVEGPWDALAATVATQGRIVGVAACGTAVTEPHLDALAATHRPLCVCMDPDPAGLHALDLITERLLARGAGHPRALTTTPGTDLGDLYRDHGGAAVLAALRRPDPAAVVYADTYLTLNPPGKWPEQRVTAARAAIRHTNKLSTDQLLQLAQTVVTRTGLGLPAVVPIIIERLPAPTPAGPGVTPVRPTPTLGTGPPAPPTRLTAEPASLQEPGIAV